MKKVPASTMHASGCGACTGRHITVVLPNKTGQAAAALLVPVDDVEGGGAAGDGRSLHRCVGARAGGVGGRSASGEVALTLSWCKEEKEEMS